MINNILSGVIFKSYAKDMTNRACLKLSTFYQIREPLLLPIFLLNNPFSSLI